jgi:hypothetical protein
MAVSADVQMAVSTRYAQLADSITHGHENVEKAMLAPHFKDRAKIKLDVFEYDPLTVLVQKIELHGKSMLVHAQWVGVGKNRENTVDRWLLLNGTWRLAERD